MRLAPVPGVTPVALGTPERTAAELLAVLRRLKGAHDPGLEVSATQAAELAPEGAGHRLCTGDQCLGLRGGRCQRPVDQPAHTITGGATAAWIMRANAMTNACIRYMDEPAPTITAGHSTGERKWYPEGADSEDRSNGVQVTVREAGILQTFPADHPWQGAKGKQFLQCGNAVPPGLALHALAAAAGVSAREVAA